MSSYDVNNIFLIQQLSAAEETDNIVVQNTPETTTIPKIETTIEDELVVVDELEDDVVDSVIEEDLETTETIDSSKVATETTEISEVTEAEETEEENEEITLSDFKKFFSENEEIDELLAEFGYEEAFKLFDKDEDGVISSDEIKELNENYKSIKDFTLDDIKKILEENGLEKTEETEETYTEEEVNEILDELKNELSSQMEAAQTQSAIGSSGGGYSGGYSGGNSNSTDNSTAQEEKVKTLEEMDISELNTKKEEKETEAKKANDAILDIYSGDNEAVDDAQDEVEDRKDDYDDAIEKDEKVSDELKEQRNTNLEAIDDKEEEINDCKTDITNTEFEISSTENLIASLESNLAALNSSLSTLNGQTAENPEDQAKIDAQKQTVQSQIDMIQNELDKANGDLSDLNSKLEELNSNLSTKESELQTLMDEKSEIETKIEKTCDENTKEAIKDYNKALKNLDKVKETELKKAEKELKTIEKDLDKINSVYNDKMSDLIIKSNAVNTDPFDEDITFDTEYITKDGVIPYALMTPSSAEEGGDLPVLIYLHGSGEKGVGGDSLINAKYSPTSFMQQWGLENFNGYVVCPQLTGEYNAGAWCNERAEGYLKTLVEDLSNTYNIDSDKIFISGGSLGGQGAIYMAGKMGDVFSKGVILSGYSQGVNPADINIPVRGYVGSTSAGEDSASYNYMVNQVANGIGEENVHVLNASHGDLPQTAFGLDEDGNGRSDIMEWLLSDEE